MSHFGISKGLDIPVKGSADRVCVDAPYLKEVALYPPEFHYLRPKLLVKEGEAVHAGTPIFFFKDHPATLFVSPASGHLSKIQYGAKRKILGLIIETDGKNTSVNFGTKTRADIDRMSRDDMSALLQETGCLMWIRQRPFNRVPDPRRVPKSIFVNGMDSTPNALDQSVVLKERKEDLQLGIAVLKKMTEGEVYLCHHPDQKGVYASLDDVTRHTFSGPHPSGLVSTHISRLAPINKGDTVWHVRAVHLAALGASLRKGHFDASCVVALTGQGVRADFRKYHKTIIGASVASILKGKVESGEQRVVSGSVLDGMHVGEEGYLAFYETNLSVIPEGRKRDFMGWIFPGFKKYSACSRVYTSSMVGANDFDFTTSLQGSERTIVWTDVYDDLTPLDLYTNFLIKAIMAGDVEDAENLGVLEVAPEDFALATFLCPSKVEVSDIIQRGLDDIEREGY